MHASSGTTGKPTVVGYTARDIDTWSTLMARSIRAAGGRPGDIVHVAYGYGLFTGGLGAHYGAERLGCTVIPMSGGQTERQVQLIVDFQPDVIMVTPSYMLNIAEEFARQQIDPRTCSLKIGIFGAEPWTDAMRADIEARLDIDAVDLYGLSEVIGPGVAGECVESKDGPVIWEDHFYPEIIDPETGAVLPDGERGELVFTSLTKEALPVIRYRTRDLTTLLPPTSRSMRRMAKVTGRTDDMMIIRGVNVFPSQIEELILKQSPLTPHYVLELSRDGSLDRLTVRVESDPARHGEPGRARGRRPPPPAPHQVVHRRDRGGRRLRSRIHRAIGRQGETRDRPPIRDVTRDRHGACSRDGAGALRGRLFPRRRQASRPRRPSHVQERQMARCWTSCASRWRSRRPSSGGLIGWTSGIVVVARNSVVHAALQRAMAGADCHKDYLAIVHGRRRRAAERSTSSCV